jgi:hypothetical protein
MEPRATQPHRNAEDRDVDYPRHQHHHRPSPVGHWTRTIGALVPLVIGEIVQDPAKKWRFIRVASVALAVINEASYAYQVQQERNERERPRDCGR